MIRPVTTADAAAITALYNPYIERTVISFEQNPVSISEMTARIRAISAAYPYFVWENGGEVLGYACLHQWNERYAYHFVAEDSIYLKMGYERRGIGTALLTALLEAARNRAFHAVVAAITVPNAASTGLHERFGFQKAGVLRELGYKCDTWLDVGYWQLLLKETT
jgi:phosphinothricin acetyltransferase